MGNEGNWVEFIKGTPEIRAAAVLFPNLRYDVLTNCEMIVGMTNEIKRRANPGDKILEVGFGTGYTAISLSLSTYEVYGIDNVPELLEMATRENEKRKGTAVFSPGDAFDLKATLGDATFKVTYHQGFLEHFTDEEVITLLRQQMAISEWVVASIPSVHYKIQDFGNERLLNIIQWNDILKKEFNKESIESISYYENLKHILIVLKGDLDDRGSGEIEGFIGGS